MSNSTETWKNGKSYITANTNSDGTVSVDSDGNGRVRRWFSTGGNSRLMTTNGWDATRTELISLGYSKHA